MPHSRRFDDIYYSHSDALAESEHVFLEGNRLHKRWTETTSNQQSFLIAELGFGAGLNFLKTLQLWRSISSQQRSYTRLHYLGIEKYPFTLQQLQSLHAKWPSLNQESDLMLAIYEGQHAGWHRLQISESVCLDLFIGDALGELQLRARADQKVDAWFIDGFSPQRNPELWNQPLFEEIASHSHEFTSVSTYSSAGAVRRGLLESGFAVEKTAGFANKRHMLRADSLTKTVSSTVSSSQPWLTYPTPQSNARQAIVIGGGLAGASTAYALARRNWAVSVYEAAESTAAAASGIPQLAMRCRLFNESNVAARYFLQSYCYGLRSFNQLQANHDIGWHRTGVVQTEHAMNKRRALAMESISQLYDSSIARLEQDTGTIRFDSGGWIDPILLCNFLLHHDAIELHLHHCISALNRTNAGWQLLDADSNIVDQAPVVIIAAGAGLPNFTQTQHLPVELSYGQSTSIYTEPELDSLHTVMSAQRSIFPEYQGKHTISASYRETAGDANDRQLDEDENLRAAAKMLQAQRGKVLQVAGNHRAARVNTRDRLPMIGMAPDYEGMEATYKSLRRNARQQFSEPGSYHRDLYINAAHGSNGLATAPLAGEYLASMIAGESLPLDSEIMDALNPCRFQIQDLKKQRERSV